MKKIILSPVVLALLGGMAGAAKVDITRNTAKAGGTKLKAGSELTSGADISTGSKSKIQLSVGSHGGTYRAGSLTDAVLTSEQNLSLKKGILLSSSGGKGFSRESLSVETPEVRSTVKGTMLVAYQPEAYIKITCIEGRVSVKLKAALGEFVDLKAGQMVIINPADKGLPESVEVDLKELAKTSALMSNDFPPLGSSPALSTATSRQERAVRGGDLAATNLQLNGASPAVSVEAGIEGQRQVPPEKVTPPKAETPPPRRAETGGGTQELPVPPVTPEPPEPKDGYVIDPTTVFAPPALTTPTYPTITGDDHRDGSTLYEFPAGTVNPALLIRGTVNIPASPDGTEYLAHGLLQIGDGGSTLITPSDDITFNALTLQLLKAQITSPYHLAFDGENAVSIASSQIAGSVVDVYSPASVTVSASELTGDPGLYVVSGGGISILNSTLKGNTGLQVGNGDPLSSAIVALQSSTLLSSAGGIEIYSNGTDPEVDNIVIGDSTITSGYAGVSGVPAVQIGNDDTSGGQFTGGIQILSSRVSAVKDIGVSTGVATISNAGTITLDQSTLRSSEGSVNLANKGSNGTRRGILVQNSSQLLALASSGSVRLTTNGSQIHVVDSSLTGGSSPAGSTAGAGGEVLIDAMAGPSPIDTLVMLNNVTASADLIRARSYGSGDKDSLVITGGRYDAASALKFYAEGASKLRFVGNVTLNTPNADLAGKIVQVDSGGTVTGSGRINVYADDHRYNSSPTNGGPNYGTIRSTNTNLNDGLPYPDKFAARPGF